MAKKKAVRKKAVRGTNRSQAIREQLKANPKTSSVAIKSELAKQGIEVSDTLISSVRKRFGAPLRKRRKTKGAKTTAAPRRAKAEMVALVDLRATRKFVAEVGGVDKAKALLSAVAEFM